MRYPGRRASGALGQVQVAFWVVVVAVIAFYVAGLVFTVFDPLDMWAFTAVVVVLVAMLVLHEVRIVRALRDQDAPGHDELRRKLSQQRETRGF
jgi:hypothetical protein